MLQFFTKKLKIGNLLKLFVLYIIEDKMCVKDFCMNEISQVSAYSIQNSNLQQKSKVVNFRSGDGITKPNSGDNRDSFVSEYEKQKKKANRDKNISLGLSVFMATAFAAIAAVTLHQSGIFGKKVQKAIAKDITNEKTLKELALGKELQKQTEEIKLMIDRKDVFREKGLKSMPPIFVYSEPGAGKNAWVYGLAKDTNAKLFEVNVLKFNDMYNGQSENNILKFIENAAKEAKKNPNQTVIVYFDEIDSVAMKDNSVNSTFTNKLHNAFKTGFNELLKIPNVQIIGSSNKACKEEALTTLLDEAIINRFGKKIFVPLPNSEQLQNCMKTYFEKITNKKYIAQELTENSENIKKMCDYLSQDGHHLSFRDMEDIISQAVVLSEKEAKGYPIEMKHVKEAVLEKANQLNWPPSEIEAFMKTLV